MTPNDWDNPALQSGFVTVCRVCNHTSDHGRQQDPRLKSTMMDGVTPRVICQVPVRTPIPNQPGVVIATPCGCDGTGEPIIPEPPVVLKPPPQCFRPGCPEFAAGNSSFCSDVCKDAMAAAIAKFGGDYGGNTERASGAREQESRSGDQGSGHREEGRSDQGVQELRQNPERPSDGDAVDDRRGLGDEQDVQARAARGAEGNAGGEREPGNAGPAEIDEWLDA